MDEKTKEGYVTGVVCIFVFALFAYFTYISISNQPTAVILGIFAVLFGGLGFGSIWKPNSIGAITTRILNNFARNSETASSDSHDKQVQKESSGVQVMSHDQSSVNIVVHSGKKGQVDNLSEKEGEKGYLRKEKIVVIPSGSYFYEFELMKNDHLRGEIFSSSPVDVYFLDEFNFNKWNNGRKYFEPENSSEAILECNIDYEVVKEGSWYLIIENNGRKSATVKIRLY